MTLAVDSLVPLILTVGSLLVSVLLVLRRNGSGNGHASGSPKLEEELRRERDWWRDQAMSLMSQGDDGDYDRMSALADRIEAQFSLEEIDGLAFSTGVNPDNIPGKTAESRARELVVAAARRGRLARLERIVERERPSASAVRDAASQP